MKNQITFFVIATLVALGGIFIVTYEGKPEAPLVGEDGKISGAYSIEGVMDLGRPYVCTFEKQDENSKVAGIIHTDGKNIYGEFRILSEALKGEEFSSFLIVMGKDAYTWTSLAPVGYKTKVVKNTSVGASPGEQAQLVGLRDKVEYECEPWAEADPTLFELPGWITFTELPR